MPSEVRTCQNCKGEFTIEPEDLSFYEKMKVPPPTWCPECRMIRRMMWRNERFLHRKKGMTPDGEKEMVSVYAPDKPVTIFDQKHWWSDAWDPLHYGKDYDFSVPFFQQFSELFHRVPLLHLSNSNAENSEYCNVADRSKDSYLVSGSYKIDRVLYSNRVYLLTDSMDTYVISQGELCYDDVACTNSHRLFYSADSDTCTDSYFLYDCRNCLNCFGCTNLRNKQFYIFNAQYSKEDYFRKISEFNLGSHQSVEKLRVQFAKFRARALHRFAQVRNSENVTGDHIDNAKNCHYAFDITQGAEDCKYIHWGGIGTKDSYDAGPGVGDGEELAYEVMDSKNCTNISFVNVVYNSHDIRYALYCHDSVNLFGCIGLRHKKYCILNKQYTKEEYEALVPKIIEHMSSMPYVDAKGREFRYGEFFPPEHAPYAYNESVAQDYFPLTKEGALEREYPWRDREERTQVATIQADALPNNIQEVTDEILQAVIGCEHVGACADGCTEVFKLTPAELDFYRRREIPIPHLCFNCRHARRLALRNPMRLWHRQCRCDYAVYKNSAKHAHHESDHCLNEFETTYAPERPEIVYCEQCYQAEVA